MPSRAYLGRFNFKGQDQQKLVGNLSGGERGRLHLAETLLPGGNVLLLDEPSNDLDVETLRALEDALLEFAGSVMVISHDRWFLDRIATHILAFEGESQAAFSRATTRSTKQTSASASARRPRSRTASASRRSSRRLRGILQEMPHAECVTLVRLPGGRRDDGHSEQVGPGSGCAAGNPTIDPRSQP